MNDTDTPLYWETWWALHQPPKPLQRRFADVVPFAAVFFALTLLAVLVEVWR